MVILKSTRLNMVILKRTRLNMVILKRSRQLIIMVMIINGKLSLLTLLVISLSTGSNSLRRCYRLYSGLDLNLKE